METPTLKPFSNAVCCEKCGYGEHVTQVPEFPIPLPSLALSSAFDIRYCAGGKEPENPGEQNPVAGFLQAIGQTDPRMFASSLPPRINICAGIGEEHLHVTCRQCRHEFLIETKSAAAV